MWWWRTHWFSFNRPENVYIYMRCVCPRHLVLYLYSHDAHRIYCYYLCIPPLLLPTASLYGQNDVHIYIIHMHVYRYNTLPYIDVLILGCWGLGRVGDLYAYKLYYTAGVYVHTEKSKMMFHLTDEHISFFTTYIYDSDVDRCDQTKRIIYHNIKTYRRVAYSFLFDVPANGIWRITSSIIAICNNLYCC